MARLRSPWAQSGWRCVTDRCRFIRKQLSVSSRRATKWETPPPTPRTPAASAGAAAVAAPGRNCTVMLLAMHTQTHEILDIYGHFICSNGFSNGPCHLLCPVMCVDCYVGPFCRKVRILSLFVTCNL